MAAAGAGLPGATALGAERRLSEVRRRAGAEQVISPALAALKRDPPSQAQLEWGALPGLG